MHNEILSLKGQFIGEGINHDNQSFEAQFIATQTTGVRGVAFRFEARGKDQAAFHLESSLLGHNMKGELALWVMSSNHPGIFERPLKSANKTEHGTEFIFSFGDKDNRNVFREEISLDIRPSSVRYVYSWGMPGGDFAERSGCTMKRVD